MSLPGLIELPDLPADELERYEALGNEAVSRLDVIDRAIDESADYYLRGAKSRIKRLNGMIAGSTELAEPEDERALPPLPGSGGIPSVCFVSPVWLPIPPGYDCELQPGGQAYWCWPAGTPRPVECGGVPLPAPPSQPSPPPSPPPTTPQPEPEPDEDETPLEPTPLEEVLGCICDALQQIADALSCTQPKPAGSSSNGSKRRRRLAPPTNGELPPTNGEPDECPRPNLCDALTMIGQAMACQAGILPTSSEEEEEERVISSADCNGTCPPPEPMPEEPPPKPSTCPTMTCPPKPVVDGPGVRDCQPCCPPGQEPQWDQKRKAWKCVEVKREKIESPPLPPSRSIGPFCPD